MLIHSPFVFTAGDSPVFVAAVRTCRFMLAHTHNGHISLEDAVLYNHIQITI